MFSLPFLGSTTSLMRLSSSGDRCGAIGAVLEARALDAGPVVVRGADGDVVAAGLEAVTEGQVRVQVAEGALGGEEDPAQESMAS